MEQPDLIENLPRDFIQVKEANNLSQNLREILKIFKISQTEFVRRTGIPPATISDWINGKAGRQLAGKDILRLAREFGYTVDTLLFGDVRSVDLPKEIRTSFTAKRVYLWVKKVIRKNEMSLDEKTYEEGLEIAKELYELEKMENEKMAS